jgi:hypothetical protein
MSAWGQKQTFALQQVMSALPKAGTCGATRDVLCVPHITDEPILTLMRRIGIERGKSFDIDKVDPAIKAGLETVPEDAQKLMAWKTPNLARVVNGWSMNTDTMGVYGNYYLKRAIITQLGLGANLPEDAIYPSTSPTTQASRWMALTTIRYISTRARRRR